MEANNTNLIVYFDDRPEERLEIQAAISDWKRQHHELVTHEVELTEDDISESSQQRGAIEKLSAAVTDDDSKINIALISDVIDLTGKSHGFLSVFKAIKTFGSQHRNKLGDLFVALRSSLCSAINMPSQLKAFTAENIETLHSDTSELSLETNGASISAHKNAYELALTTNDSQLLRISKDIDPRWIGLYAFLDKAFGLTD